MIPNNNRQQKQLLTSVGAAPVASPPLWLVFVPLCGGCEGADGGWVATPEWSPLPLSGMLTVTCCKNQIWMQQFISFSL